MATKVVLFFVLEKNWLEKGPPPETKLMLLGMVGGKVSKSFALFFTMMIWMDGRTTDRQMEAVHDVHMDFNNCDEVDSARSKIAMITLSSVFVFPIRVPPCPRLS